METLKILGGCLLVGLFIVGFGLVLDNLHDEVSIEVPAVTNKAVVVTCEDLFTFGGIHYKETVFQGDKMVAIFSSGRKNFSFVRRDGGCWKFIGRNDRHETKKRKSTE